MKTRALDSWAILEWMSGRQPATQQLGHLLAEAERGHARLFMSAINAGEVYYFLKKRQSEEIAESWRASWPTMPVAFEVPSGDEIWAAAAIKGLFPISYADAFAAALALKHRCPLVTGDREFKLVDLLELEWLGRG